MTFDVKSSRGKYDIVIERGLLEHVEEYIPTEKKILIVTDSKIPPQYSEAVKSRCKEAAVYIMEAGESYKTLETVEAITELMKSNGFGGGDCVVAIGGGVVGDVAGFAASLYAGGVDFINIPTTVLSQVDSSIGGKTAVNYRGVKNIIGAFYPPKKVLIDPEVLKTLDKRLFNEGMAEALKMAATFDRELFGVFENEDICRDDVTDLIIEKALRIKKSVVERDEREAGLRMVLNFGHTIGHGIESVSNEGSDPLFHGECVALGMLYMCSKEVKERLMGIYRKLGLPTEYELDTDRVTEVIKNDKKRKDGVIKTIYVENVGEYKVIDSSVEDLKKGLSE